MGLTDQSSDESLGRRWRIYPVSIRVVGLLCLLAFSGTTTLRATEPPSNEPTNGYEIHWGLHIPTRDGTKLNATAYLPIKKEDGTLVKEPTVLLLTPYVSDSYHGVASYFAKRGYGFLLVDCRGRGNSQGSFDPFVNDANDAYDAVEWIAKQDFSSGKVTMWGGSYSGMNQWLAAKQLPPHLAAIVPVAAARPGYDFPNYRSLPTSYTTQWLTLIAGVTVQHELFGDNDFWIQSFYRAYQNCIPFRDLDSFIGNPSPIFQKWLQHPDVDSYWLSLSPTPEELAKITIPVLTITGQYDGDEFGDLSFYKDYLRAGASAQANSYLVMGPWDHPGTRNPKSEVGGVKFGPASLLDVKDLHRRWWDWILKSGPKPDFLKDHVAYYLIGPGNEGKGSWEYATSLESIEKSHRSFFLDSANGAKTLFASGILDETTPRGGNDSYVYDPLDLHRGEQVENIPYDNAAPDVAGPPPITTISNIDQRLATNINGDGLIYQSNPMPAEVILAGFPSLVLWLSLDVPDTDIEVNLYEVLPEGVAINIWSDVLRARYRESERSAKLITPGEIDRYYFDPRFFVARRLAKGSRLRLIVSAPNSIYFEKNYNSGGIVEDETKADAHTAHVVLYHDAEHASSLTLPIGSTEK